MSQVSGSGRADEAQPGGRAVLARVRGLQSSLTPSEAAVARLILNDPAGSVRLSVEALAQRAGVSTTTVMRLCQTLGFGGFKDLKLTLAAEVGGGVAVLPDPVQSGDSPLQIATKVFQADIEAIRQTLGMLDEKTLSAAVERLDGARKVEVYGVGSSAPIATDAYYRLLRIGLEVSVVTDSHMQAVSAGLLTPRDVALVISHTGRTSETLSAASHAKARGATVIGLTSFFRTPLVELADLSLITATAETTFRAEVMASRIAHLSVIDALYVALATRRFDRALAALEHTGKIIEDKRV
jgi:DNA-binding MurR/RpiR family transcriptional regulator